MSLVFILFATSIPMAKSDVSEQGNIVLPREVQQIFGEFILYDIRVARLLYLTTIVYLVFLVCKSKKPLSGWEI